MICFSFQFQNQMGDSNISSPGLQPSAQLSNLGSTETLEETPSASQDKVGAAEALALPRVTKHRGILGEAISAVQILPVSLVIYLSGWVCTGNNMVTATLVICPAFPSGFCRSLHSGCRAFAIAAPFPALHPAARLLLINPKLDHGFPLLKTASRVPSPLDKSRGHATGPPGPT